MLRHEKTRKLKLNQPTENEVKRVLTNILECEMGSGGVIEHKATIDDVKVKANKDMRSAIQLLQFYMGGKVREPVIDA